MRSTYLRLAYSTLLGALLSLPTLAFGGESFELTHAMSISCAREADGKGDGYNLLVLRNQYLAALGGTYVAHLNDGRSMKAQSILLQSPMVIGGRGEYRSVRFESIHGDELNPAGRRLRLEFELRGAPDPSLEEFAATLQVDQDGPTLPIRCKWFDSSAW